METRIRPAITDSDCDTNYIVLFFFFWFDASFRSNVLSMNSLAKRKAVESLEKLHNKPTKQPRLDAFFLPVRDAGTTSDQARPAVPPITTKSTACSATKSKVEVGPRLSDEQKNVLRIVVEEGKNVFFTGSAGSSAPPHLHSSWASKRYYSLNFNNID